MLIVDTHSHLIPAIDDGAKNMDETLEMCQIAEKENISKIIATPHFIRGEFFSTPRDVKDNVKNINKKLRELGIDVKIYSGHEVFIDPDIPKLLINGEINTLNDSRYVLIELPMNGIPSYTEDTLYSIRLKGYVPVIAHPERNSEIINDPNILFRLIELGAVSQMTTFSLLGKYGERIQKVSEEMLRHNLVHLMATDAHTPRRRSPKIVEAQKRLVDMVGAQKANTIMANGERILQNQELEIFIPHKIEKLSVFSKMMKKLRIG
ncbi:capsular biosynthesis protein [Alkalicella caledoniensis]|uniref:protein-tyrosine-phosphatase n=1 Tax=Alkalicella caledoniensis TaxID=2731377 RepID=A0A7G9W7F3_ALKCA|nr:CpsB/CapC family capsule biosynthesis tyrosine phosphatase [Alkalicella caledoniensis]QNO14615.1 capsular biosynthesis protein [Alkalicella caledoniensis]